MITILGATGYTGRLVANAIDAAGLPYRLAGRSLSKLCELADSLSARPACLQVDVRRADDLPCLLKGTRVLINCVGPFTDLGEAVVRATVLGGVHYLDTTNELGFVVRLRAYDGLAKSNRVIVVPACAFEVAVSDCAVAMMVAKMQEGAYRRADVVYHVPGKGASDGTRRSAIRALGTSWFVYQNGRLHGRLPGSRVRQFDLWYGRKMALSFPSCETVAWPLHVPVQSVGSWMTGSPGMFLWAPLLVPLFALLARSVLRELPLGLLKLYPAVQDGIRSRDEFEVAVFVQRGSGESCRVSVIGQGVYEQTALILARAVGQILSGAVTERGLLSPARVLGEGCLQALGLRVEEEQLD